MQIMQGDMQIPENPFKTGERKGQELQAVDVQSRLDMVKHFTADQCRDALWLEGHEHLSLQKTVIEALHRRVRALAKQEDR
jgi:hypothetical protein